ncbi:hypothetical protein M501DRAFT_602365, partial [Patellaria atrata CBS 101060]
SFNGFCNFYRKFLEKFGRVIRPLTIRTRKGVWKPLGQKEEEAFKKAKELILSDQVLAHYDPLLETKVESDYSDGVAVVVMSQLHGHVWKPVTF